MADLIRVNGLTELVAACDELAGGLKVGLREQLKSRVGEPVAREVRALFVSADLQSDAVNRLKTADGIKAQVGKDGTVYVVQTLRKSRVQARRRHNYGRLQMEHGFLPGLEAKEESSYRAIGEIVDEATHKHW